MYRLMRLIDGDECMIAEYSTYEETAIALDVYAKGASVCLETLPQIRSELSIWHSVEGIVGIINPATNSLVRRKIRTIFNQSFH